MAQMILHVRELIRIYTLKNYIEITTSDRRSGNTRYNGTHAGDFIDLIDYGSEIIACTSKGIFSSTNGGGNWHSRYSGNLAGSFIQLVVDGRDILATTTKGLYYSNNGGLSWHRR